MAKPLVVALGPDKAAFAITRIERSRIYGLRKRVATDPQGRPCVRAALTQDGQQLLLGGMLAQGYFTRDGRWVARSEMVGLDEAGTTVESRPSTLGVEQTLSGPVSPAELVDLAVDGVFWLEPGPDAGPLLEKLKRGEIYRCPFSYAATFELSTAFLLANDDGVFAIVGRPTPECWVEEGEVFVPTDADEDTDDLDFDSL